MSDLTMLEAADYSEDTKSAVFAKQIVEESPIAELAPIRTIPGVAYSYSQEQSLGNIGWRGVGESWTSSSGIIRREVETLYIAGGEVFLDNYEIQAAGGVAGIPNIKPHKYQQKARAMGLFLSQQFFEGDRSVNPKGMDGLRRRITGSQLIDAGSSPGGATLTLRKLRELCDAVVGGPDALFMNKKVRDIITELVMTQTGSYRIETTQDAFGRQVKMFDGIPIRVIERLDDASTFLEFNEDDGSGNADTTSIYAVKFGPEYVHLIADKAMPAVKDFGEIQSRPGHLGRIEWMVGMAIEHPRAAARLYHINLAYPS